MNIGQVQIPNFAATLAQGQQANLSRLQMMAMRQDMADAEAVRAALGENGAAALFGADEAARQSVLARLAGAGSRGLQLAMPVYQQQQQRVRPMSPEERATWGVRGTFAVDGLGRPVQVEASDMLSPGAEAQRVRIAGASRAPQAPLIVPPGASVVGRDGQPVFTAPARPQSPFEGSQGGAPQIIADLAPRVAAGTATPQEQRIYALAVGQWQTSGAQAVERVNPETGAVERILVPRPLPEGFPAPLPFGAVAAPPSVSGGATPSAPAQAPAAGAQPAPAAAPTGQQQQGAVPIPGTNLAAAPPDPNAPRVLSSTAQQPSANDRTRLRTIEVEAKGIRDALQAFRSARRSASLAERVSAAAGMPTALSTAWSNAALLAKGEALYNLGVLNGPDLTIIQRTLSDPATLRGFFTGEETAEAQIRAIEQLLDQRLAAARTQFGGRQQASPTEQPSPEGVQQHYLNGRRIIVRDGRWVYEDNGRPAE